jgi:N-acetylglucosaminyldiphosphoundecaprenol N-acetyl-beta-D-mannosaminyltransferase
MSAAVEQSERSRKLRAIRLMGLDVTAVSEQEAIEYVLHELSCGRGGRVCSANVDILRQWKHSDEVRNLLASADLVLADGMPLVWASQIQGTPLPERVAGSSLTVTLTAAAARAGASVFLIGGNPGTADEAARRLSDLNPELSVVGTICPPFGFEQRDGAIEQVGRALEFAAPNIVYLGLPFVQQGRLMRELGAYVPQAWFVGCGVTFSFIAGEFHRAPGLVQRLGLEWAYRLVQEPRRLWRRYLVLGVPFALELLASALVNRA